MERAKTDLAAFMFGFAVTLDEADPDHAYKPFPDLPYLRALVWVWDHYRLMLVAKSRQLRVTWFFVIAFLHAAAYNDGRQYFFQSKVEEDADKLLDRAEVVLSHLPVGLRPVWERKYCQLRFPERNSVIHAVSQSPDAIVSKTASGIFSDEMSIQPYSRDAFFASLPAIGSTGRYAGAGTPRGQNFFYRIYADRLDEDTGPLGVAE